MTEDAAQRLTKVLAAAGLSPGQVAAWHPLGGGTFNSVYLVRLADGARLVVKIPPPDQTPVLSHEQRILTTEALYYQRAAGLPGVSVPSVVAADPDGRYLVLTECPGRPWPELSPPPGDIERAALRAELGRQVGTLHAVTGTAFGYPSKALGPLRGTWSSAFLGMVHAVLADAETFGVPLPLPGARIRDLFDGQAPLLDEVTVPVLVHFDLWDGNVLIDSGPSGRRLGAVIDAERAFWGDPVAEFVSLALFGGIARDAAFLDGYRSAGGCATLDAAALRRLELYRAYLYLIMWIEAAPRGYDDARRKWLRAAVFEPLAATFAAWAAAGRLPPANQGPRAPGGTPGAAASPHGPPARGEVADDGSSCRPW